MGESKETDVVYRYEGKFATVKEAGFVAVYFHETLKGNQDYVDSRILLHWDDCDVELIEFSDSKTHIHVDTEVDGTEENPILELLVAD